MSLQSCNSCHDFNNLNAAATTIKFYDGRSVKDPANLSSSSISKTLDTLYMIQYMKLKKSESMKNIKFEDNSDKESTTNRRYEYLFNDKKVLPSQFTKSSQFEKYFKENKRNKTNQFTLKSNSLDFTESTKSKSLEFTNENPKVEKKYKATPAFLYHKIFKNLFKPKKMANIDNTLNLFCVKNSAQFREKMKEMKKKSDKAGKKFIIRSNSMNSRIATMLGGIKNKINLIQGASNYSFPKIIVTKIKEEEKINAEFRKNAKKMYKPPYQKIDEYIEENKKINSENLKQSLVIKHI